MKPLPDRIAANAFALSSARGAELLAHLGDFNVWLGDLATMRDDDPRTVVTEDEPTAAQLRMRDFLETLVLARAIELLQPDCRAALSVVYSERKLTESPRDLDCEKRLLEIYDSLKASEQDETTVPQWLSEREHALWGHGRR